MRSGILGEPAKTHEFSLAKAKSGAAIRKLLTLADREKKADNLGRAAA